MLYGLTSGLDTGQSSSSTPSWENHFCMNLDGGNCNVSKLETLKKKRPTYRNVCGLSHLKRNVLYMWQQKLLKIFTVLTQLETAHKCFTVRLYTISSIDTVPPWRAHCWEAQLKDSLFFLCCNPRKNKTDSCMKNNTKERLLNP